MDLSKELLLGNVKDNELEMVFLSYFGRGSRISENVSIYRKDSDSECKVEIEYNEKGKIIKATGGTKLTKLNADEIAKKINEELISNQDIAIGRSVCFVRNEKNSGAFLYKDKFQLLPLPEDAPEILHQTWGYHPILLEYKYTSSRNLMVDNLRKSRVLRELISILHLFSYGKFHGESRYMDFAWVLKQEEGKKNTSEFKQVGFFYDPEISEPKFFSKQSSFPRIPFGRSKGNELTLSTEIVSQLDKIFSLDEDNYSKFIASAYWFYTASEVWRTSHSVSYVCLVTSIECLMNNVEKCKCGSAIISPPSSRCESCNEPMYRIGKSFKEFLEEYAKDDFSKLTDREKSFIYSTRSLMLHGEKLFVRDVEPMGFLGFSIEQEDIFHRTISKLVSNALVNWLESK